MRFTLLLAILTAALAAAPDAAKGGECTLPQAAMTKARQIAEQTVAGITDATYQFESVVVVGDFPEGRGWEKYVPVEAQQTVSQLRGLLAENDRIVIVPTSCGHGYRGTSQANEALHLGLHENRSNSLKSLGGPRFVKGYSGVHIEEESACYRGAALFVYRGTPKATAESAPKVIERVIVEKPIHTTTIVREELPFELTVGPSAGWMYIDGGPIEYQVPTIGVTTSAHWFGDGVSVLYQWGRDFEKEEDEDAGLRLALTRDWGWFNLGAAGVGAWQLVPESGDHYRYRSLGLTAGPGISLRTNPAGESGIRPRLRFDAAVHLGVFNTEFRNLATGHSEQDWYGGWTLTAQVGIDLCLYKKGGE